MVYYDISGQWHIVLDNGASATRGDHWVNGKIYWKPLFQTPIIEFPVGFPINQPSEDRNDRMGCDRIE